SISAYSIASAFGMLYGGSVNPAHDQIAETLHFDLADEQQHVAHNWLDSELAMRNMPASEPDLDDATVLQTANGLWMLDDYDDGVSTDFLDLLAIHYDVGMQLAAFNVDPEAARERINGWVSDRTNDLIPELFPELSIHQYTTLALVNALYLKAPWHNPFEEGFTQPHDFTRLDDQVVSVEMMHAPYLSWVDHVATAEYQAVSVLLDGGYLDVVVILPEDFSAFEDAL